MLLALVVFSTSVFADRANPPEQRPRILIIGDSLSAAHGLKREDGWVNLLQQRLEARGYPHEVINRSKHGMTTQRALRDIEWFVEVGKPELVLIELGGVDGFLNIPIDALHENLTELVETARDGGAQVGLLEMALPPFGPDVDLRYADRFRGTYHQVANAEGARLVPFFLASFADSPENFQRDGIHPKAEVQLQMLDAVWPTVRQLLPPPPQQLRVSAPQHSSDAGGQN